jgi:uncharacterized membrane protein
MHKPSKIMKIAKGILTLLFALFLILGGVNHFLKPAMYLPFVPTGLPGLPVIYLSGVLEVVLGIGALIPRTRSWATQGIFLLMIIFLPLHVIDVFRENPAIGSHQVALIRLPIQFVLIAWAWFIHKKPAIRT